MERGKGDRPVRYIDLKMSVIRYLFKKKSTTQVVKVFQDLNELAAGLLTKLFECLNQRKTSFVIRKLILKKKNS